MKNILIEKQFEQLHLVDIMIKKQVFEIIEQIKIHEIQIFEIDFITVEVEIEHEIK
jgi:hypothetical protein